MRISDNGVAGSAEEITSDIILPESRIPSTPEVGSESNAGDVQTEWNIDEQDEWLAGVFCNSWVTVNAKKKTLTLGETQKSFTLLERFPQNPPTWQWYRKEFINSLALDFSTDSFVKLTWNFMGSNNPQMVTSDPIADKNPTYKEVLKTKSFITKSGMWLKIGDTVGTLVRDRQSPTLNITINNNLERTPALGEDEAIENSLGNFDVTGTLEAYNVDDFGIQLYNDAVQGKDKVIQVSVSRTVNGVTTRYTLTLNVHLGAPTKSRNGNKYQFSIPFTMNDDTDLELVKEIDDGTVDAVEPVFTNTLTDATVDTSTTLDGTATVTDGGTVTYQWYKDNTEISGETDATLTVTESGIYKVVATNTNTSATGLQTATANQSCTITVE